MFEYDTMILLSCSHFTLLFFFFFFFNFQIKTSWVYFALCSLAADTESQVRIPAARLHNFRD